MSIRTHRRLALALVAAFALFWLWLSSTERMPPWDAVSLFEPYVTLLADYSRAGALLLWNPWSNGGTPDAAYVEMGSFSPLAIAIAAITGGGRGGFLAYWLFSWALGALGVLRLAQHWRVPAWAGGAIAVAYALNGFYLGHGSHLSWLHAFSFLPWALWRYEVAIEERRWLPAAQGGALWALGALAGHPALVILNGLFLAFWCALRTFDSTGGRERVRPAAALALLVAVGCAVLSPAYVTFFAEGAGFSDRVGELPRETAVADEQLEPLDLAGWTSPYLASLKLGNDERWPGLFVGITDSYVPPPIVVGALLALVLAGSRRRALACWIAAALFMLCALGEATPVRGWLYDLFPPTRYFRHTGVFRCQAIFALTVAALWGLRRWSETRAWPVLGRTTSVAALVAVVTFGGALVASGGGERSALAWLHVAGVWALLLLALRFAKRLPLAALLLLAALALDALLTIDLASPQFLARVPVGEETTPRVRSIEPGPEGWLRTRYPAGPYTPNDHLAGKVAVLEAFNQLNHRFHSRQSLVALETSWSDEPRLAASTMGRTRLWFAASAPTVVPSDACFLRFVARARELPRPPLVLHREASLPKGAVGPDDARCRALGEAPGVVELPARVLRYTPRSLELEVTAASDGWLWVTERWAPGWRASVDDSPVELLRANFLWRAVRLERGTHRVRFNYRPAGHPWLLLLSWATLILVAAPGIPGRFKG